MKNIAKWMLAAAVAIGGLGLAATPAKAAQIGFYIGTGGPAYYAPPSPGPGYVWVNGYYADGYWVPGRWAFAGVYRGPDDYYRPRDDDDEDYRFRDRDDYRFRDRDDFYRDRDHRHHGHGWDRDHDRHDWDDR